MLTLAVAPPLTSDSILVADACLVAGLQQGDPLAVGQLVTQYSPLLYRYALYHLQDAPQAEDLVAEVWARVFMHVGSYVQGSTPFQAWLLRIARNLVADQYRRRKRHPQVSYEGWLAGAPGAEPGTCDRAIDGLPLRDELAAGLQQLTAEQRQVILLHIVEGWELPQVAQITGRSLASVKSLYYRGIASLRRAVAPPTVVPRSAVRQVAPVCPSAPLRPALAWG